MTIKQLTDELYEAGNGGDEIEFVVRGEVNHNEEVDRAGEYEFSAEIDHTCEIYDIYYSKKTGKLCVILEIKDVNLNYK